VRIGAAAITLAIGMIGCSAAEVERAPPFDSGSGRPEHTRGAAPRPISASGKGAYEAALAARDDGVVTAWYDTRDGNAEIYMRLLDAGGVPAGPERRLTNGPEESYEPSIDRLDDAIAIAWYDKSRDGTLVPKLGLWSEDGSNRWVRTLAPRGRNPVISVRGGDIFAAWIAPGADGGESVWGGWWTRDGDHASARVLAPAGKTTWNLNALARDLRRAYVVFDATAGTRADELFLVDVTPDRASLVRLSADDGVPSKYPDIAGNDRLAMTWHDERDGNKEIYLLSASADQLQPGAAGRGVRVTKTPGESIGAYVGWNGNRIGLAWSDTADGQLEIYFQPFNAAGRPLSDARRVTRNATSSLIPAIEAWRTGFALAWNEYVPGAEGHAGTSEIAFTVVE
jgi:hypothetical protein